MLGLQPGGARKARVEPGQFIMNQISDIHAALYDEAPEHWDENDWHVIAAGIVMGHSRPRILLELQVMWTAAGQEYKFDDESKAMDFVGQALRAFRDQKEVLKRLFRDSKAEGTHYSHLSARMGLIDKHIRLLDASITVKMALMGDKFDMEACDAELTHLERLLKLAKGEVGKVDNLRVQHSLIPPGSGSALQGDEDLDPDGEMSPADFEAKLIEDGKERLSGP